MRFKLSSKIKKVIATLLVVIIFFTLGGIVWRNQNLKSYIVNSTFHLFRPFALLSEKIYGGIHWIVLLPSVSRERDALRAQNNDLISQLAQFNEVQKENDQLVAQLGDKSQKNKSNAILTTALGFDRSFSGAQLVLSAGSDDGIKVGMVVSRERNILVGKVSQVLPHTSYVQTILNNSTSFPIQVLPTGTSGSLSASFTQGLSVELDKTTGSQAVENGDTVITNPSDGTFAPQMLVGTIENVSVPDQQLFAHANVNPFWNGNIDGIFFVTP